MPEFQGKMRLKADPFSVVGADLDIEGGSLSLIVSNQEIGEWTITDLGIEVDIDGFHMWVEGEELVFTAREPTALAQALGVSTGHPNGTNGRSPQRTGLARSKAKESPAKLRPRRQLGSRLARIDLSNSRKRVTAGVFVVLLALAVWAPTMLSALLLITGMGGMVVASATIVDPLLAARLPENWSPTRLAVAALASTAAGLLTLAL